MNFILIPPLVNISIILGVVLLRTYLKEGNWQGGCWFFLYGQCHQRLPAPNRLTMLDRQNRWPAFSSKWESGKLKWHPASLDLVKTRACTICEHAPDKITNGLWRKLLPDLDYNIRQLERLLCDVVLIATLMHEQVTRKVNILKVRLPDFPQMQIVWFGNVIFISLFTFSCLWIKNAVFRGFLKCRQSGLMLSIPCKPTFTCAIGGSHGALLDER